MCLDPHLKAEVCLVITDFTPPVKYFLLTDPRRYFFCESFELFMSCVCHAFASFH